MNKQLTFSQRDTLIYFTAGIVSIILSLWVTRHQTINPDGICYIMSAEAYATHSIRDAIYLCPQSRWPFYSMLLFGLQYITHLSFTATAYAMNSIFSLLSVLTFIAIVKALGGSRRILWLAAGVILLAHEFNTARQYIVRDHGFWFFYLTSIYLLLRYYRSLNWKTAIAWSVSTVIATLFRVEGVVFLIAVPFLSWFCLQYSFKQRVKSFFTLNIILVGLAILGFVCMLFYSDQIKDNAGRLYDVLQQLRHGIDMLIERFTNTSAVLANSVLPIESRRDSSQVLVMMLVTWYIVSALSNMSYAYGLLILYGWWRHAVQLTQAGAVVLYGYLGINLIITIGFLFEHLFLSRRYLIAMSLVLMLWVPFALNDLMQQIMQKRHRVFSAVIAVLLFISALGGIFEFGYSKNYLPEAGAWIAKNIPANATMYANDYQLMYYSQHYGENIFKLLKPYTDDYSAIANGQWQQFDYLALRLGHKNQRSVAVVLKEIHYTPVQEFKNKRGDSVVILKIIHEHPVT